MADREIIPEPVWFPDKEEQVPATRSPATGMISGKIQVPAAGDVQ
jgi:hypothetical protein